MSTKWERIDCQQADRILAERKRVVLAGRTDTDEQESYRLWGNEDGTPVLRESFDRRAGCIHEIPAAEEDQ